MIDFLFSSLCGNGGARIVRNIEFCLLFFLFSGKKPDDIETDCERGYSWKKSGEGRTLKTNLNHLTSLPPSLLNPKPRKGRGGVGGRSSDFYFTRQKPQPQPLLSDFLSFLPSFFPPPVFLVVRHVEGGVGIALSFFPFPLCLSLSLPCPQS